MFTRFRGPVAIGASLLAIFSLGLVWQPRAQAGNDSVISGAYFEENFVFLMAACIGEPKAIPLTDSSPYLLISGESPNTSYSQQVTWLEPNCSFLFTNVIDPETDIHPHVSGFSSSAVTPLLMSFRSYLRAARGKPSSFSDVISATERSKIIYLYTDFDASGSFDPSEILSSTELQPQYIRWGYSDLEMHRAAYAERLLVLSNYDESGIVFEKVAEFIGGPLMSRNLYVVAIIAVKE